MKPRDIEPVRLPVHLQRNLVKNMPIDEAHYLLPDEVLMREDTGELFLDKRTELDDETLRPERVFGRVAIMRATILDADANEFITGYVADLRYIDKATDFEYATSAEAPDDQEDRNKWLNDKQYEVPLAAITIWDAENEAPFAVGDARFGAAALHLARLADERDELLVKRNQRSRRVDGAAKKAQQELKESYIKDADLPG